MLDEGVLEREAKRIVAEDIGRNLPPGLRETRWKTIVTCAKNWRLYMDAFGGLRGAFFFPANEASVDHVAGSQLTHNSLGTHTTKEEMLILKELIRRVFPTIIPDFENSCLDHLAADIRDSSSRPDFPLMPWEGGPRGIQHAITLAPGHPIINWKLSEHPADWAIAQPFPPQDEQMVDPAGLVPIIEAAVDLAFPSPQLWSSPINQGSNESWHPPSSPSTPDAAGMRSLIYQQGGGSPDNLSISRSPAPLPSHTPVTSTLGEEAGPSRIGNEGGYGVD